MSRGILYLGLTTDFTPQSVVCVFGNPLAEYLAAYESNDRSYSSCLNDVAPGCINYQQRANKVVVFAHVRVNTVENLYDKMLETSGFYRIKRITSGTDWKNGQILQLVYTAVQ